jgi:hypothetical protein
MPQISTAREWGLPGQGADGVQIHQVQLLVETIADRLFGANALKLEKNHLQPGDRSRTLLKIKLMEKHRSVFGQAAKKQFPTRKVAQNEPKTP